MRVLEMVGWFFPKSSGGSEIYVHSLAKALMPLGVKVEVATPSVDESPGTYEYGGVTVHRYPEIQRRTARGFPEPQEQRKRRFRDWLKGLSPDLVHFHTLTEGLGLDELREVKECSLPLIGTVHTPFGLCVRGTLLLWGESPCDGTITVSRCSACHSQSRGLPRRPAQLLARLPIVLSKHLGGLPGRLGTALGMPAAVHDHQKNVQQTFELCDRVVTVCLWLKEVLKSNGVPEDKLFFSRQATNLPRQPVCRRARGAGEPLRVGYLGRYNIVKGVDILIQAVRAIPASVPIELVLHGQTNSTNEREDRERFAALAGDDPRIRMNDPLAYDELTPFFESIDLLAVPSQWMETGPMVVMEAFAHAVPVIGSRRGGIAELVEDQTTGLLVEPADVGAWRCALEGLALDPKRLDALQPERAPQRTWNDVAGEMHELYQSLVPAGRRGCLAR